MKIQLVDEWVGVLKRTWSARVAFFWGGVGGLIVVLGAYLYKDFSWAVGLLLIAASASFAVARVLKQPGTDE